MRYRDLFEATDAGRLYHGCSAAAAAGIVYDDSFMAEWTSGDELGLGLSLSRNPTIARRFADEKSSEAAANGSADWPPGGAERRVRGTGGVILIFDRAQIAGNLVPITRADDEDGFGYEIDGEVVRDEEEERLLAQPGKTQIPDARAMISAIQPVDRLRFERFCKVLAKIAPEYSSTVAFLRAKLAG